MPTRRDHWLDEDEYPSEEDEAEFGDYSKRDSDPLTIGYVGRRTPRRITPLRVILAIVAVIFILSVFLPPLLSIFRSW